MKWNYLPFLGQYFVARLRADKTYTNLAWSVYRNYKRNKETAQIKLSTLGALSVQEHSDLIQALMEAQVRKKKEATTRYFVTDRAALLLRMATFGYRLLPYIHSAKAIRDNPLGKFAFWFVKGNHSFLLVDNYTSKESLVLYYAYITNANFRTQWSEPITWHQCARIPHFHTQEMLINNILDTSVAHHEALLDQIQEIVGDKQLNTETYDELQDELIHLRVTGDEKPHALYRRVARKLMHVNQGIEAIMRMRDAIYMPFKSNKNKYKRPAWGQLIALDTKFVEVLYDYYT